MVELHLRHRAFLGTQEGHGVTRFRREPSPGPCIYSRDNHCYSGIVGNTGVLWGIAALWCPSVVGLESWGWLHSKALIKLALVADIVNNSMQKVTKWFVSDWILVVQPLETFCYRAL